MSLAAGSLIGHYEIIAPLGAGGMGEVYRARDSKLGREVALKVLPAAVAGDRERLARFDREAGILASLNHPNTEAIHGLADSGSGRVTVSDQPDGVSAEREYDGDRRLEPSALKVMSLRPIARHA